MHPEFAEDAWQGTAAVCRLLSLAAVQQFIKVQFQLGVLVITAKFTKQQAGLNVTAILVFVAAVGVSSTFE